MTDSLATLMLKIDDYAHRKNGGYNDERETDPASVVQRHYAWVKNDPAVGTMRSWMQRYNGQEIHTVQADNNKPSGWAPVNRKVDASHSTYVELEGSARYYAGMKVLHANKDALIVQDGSHTILYVSAHPSK